MVQRVECKKVEVSELHFHSPEKIISFLLMPPEILYEYISIYIYSFVYTHTHTHTHTNTRSYYPYCFLFVCFNLFLATLGLSCGMQDLH